jgi:TPR repeat protein
VCTLIPLCLYCLVADSALFLLSCREQGAAYRSTLGLWFQKDEAKALALFQQSVELDCSAGHFSMGLCYDKAWCGVSKDSEMAFNHYLHAAELGHPDAMYELSNCFKNGTGVARDDVLAEQWMQVRSLWF